MKKITLGLLVISCFSFKTIYAQETFIKVVESTDLLTAVSLDLNITELNVTKISQETYEYTIKSSGDLIVNGEPENYNYKKFKSHEDNDWIYLAYDNLELKKSKANPDKILFRKIDPSRESDYIDLGRLSEEVVNSEPLRTVLGSALIFLNEITASASDKLSSSTAGASRRQKHGEWFIIESGYSRSKSELNAQADIARFLRKNPNCHLYGGTDTSCLTDNHICVSTQYFQCD